MKAIGIVRPLDKLGRIVLPKELRRVFDIDSGDELEIFVEEGRIILEKYAPTCHFCGESAQMVEFHGKQICKYCVEAIKNDQMT